MQGSTRVGSKPGAVPAPSLFGFGSYYRHPFMALRLFNTLTRTIETFVPLFPDHRDPAGRPAVGMYCCGPTVYDFGHIGNFRTFVFGDLVRRYLEFRGFAVRHVMNLTDVEDKIIRRAREANRPWRDLTRQFSEAFLADLDALGCVRPHDLPRATDFIPQIIELIAKLEARGIAYRAPDGSVYFSIDRYRGCGCRYGQLVNLNIDEQRRTERVASDEYDKDNLADFALWKARVPDDGDVFWDSPWGQGRPGWHIECSAMSMALLGPSFDLHLGGEDLVFPHHEDEIAQSEGAGVQAPGRPFVKHWLHGAHLLVEGKKMAKSLGNFFTVRDLLGKGFSGREIRLLLLSAHYRETFNFTVAGLEDARARLARIDECLSRLGDVAGGATAIGPAPVPLRPAVTDALDDDLNVSRAWGAVFDWIREVNRRLAAGDVTPSGAAALREEWSAVDRVFGLGGPAAAEAPAEILDLVQQRTSAKQDRDFKRADAVREELKSRGWLVEDTKTGPKLKRV
jgi:cysteinyl-tRNA synthetase